MKLEIAVAWAEALESGDFRQGSGHLYRTVDGESTYCCLGVLCELANRAGVVGRGNGYPSIWEFSTNGATLPRQVMMWSGVKTESGQFVMDDGRQNNLVALNDTDNSFREIARVIRDHADEL